MVALSLAFIVLLFLTVDFFVQRTAFRAAERAKTTVPLPAPHLAPVPAGVFLDPSHTWVQILAGGRLRVGVDALAATLLGEPDRLEIQAEGARVEKGRPLVTLGRGDRKLTLASPVDGHVARINHETADQPWKLPEQPFEGSWIYEIEPERVGATIRKMLVSDEAANWMTDELRRLRESVSKLTEPEPMVGATALDGGPPAPMLACQLDDDKWSRLVDDFFSPGAEPPKAANDGN